MSLQSGKMGHTPGLTLIISRRPGASFFLLTSSSNIFCFSYLDFLARIDKLQKLAPDYWTEVSTGIFEDIVYVFYLYLF